MRHVHLDTETELIRPGVQAPRLVVAQWTVERDPAVTMRHATSFDPRSFSGLEGWLEQFLHDELTALDGHNFAFDTAVIGAAYPRLLPRIFDAYAAGRITCTVVRQKLLDIAHGCYRGRNTGRHWGYALDECVSRMVPGFLASTPLDKSATSWRLRYGELIDVPLSDWPPEAVAYCRGDALAQQALYWAQESARFSVESDGSGVDYLADQYRQSAAAFWLRLAECWGVHTDPEAVEEFHALCVQRHEKNRAELVSCALVRKDGTRDIKAARAWMERVCRDLGVEPTLTAKGAIGLDEDSILQTGDATLIKLQEFASIGTLLSRVERLRRGYSTPIQPRFDSLVETGRTSCSQGDTKPGELPSAYGFQLQNPPTAPGVRECFVPRPGCWFLSIDYSGIELRTWAQVCLWTVGFSRMAEVLNAGRDPHTELGATLAHISIEEALALSGEAKSHFKKHERQSAKIANFGFPGGMGASTLRASARAQYGVQMTDAESVTLRDAWRETWPEAAAYFAWVNGALNGDGEGELTQFGSGRVRGRVGYCQMANSGFQGLAADLAKDAGFRIARACYVDRNSPLFGSRVWNFAHDEFLLEVPADVDRAGAATEACRALMLDAGRHWLPDLAPSVDASPALMAHRWAKGAEDTRDASGRLIPWDWTEEERRIHDV